jgi:transcription-repair coupling factor (superfamily II helicase)
MDGLETEQEIIAFEQRLNDRFGPIPSLASDLIQVVRLRLLAKQLGMEKVILKNGQMICYFVSNPMSSFYQSPVFENILNYIRNHLKSTRLREQNTKRSLVVENIENIQDALAQLKSML